MLKTALELSFRTSEQYFSRNIDFSHLSVLDSYQSINQYIYMCVCVCVCVFVCVCVCVYVCVCVCKMIWLVKNLFHISFSTHSTRNGFASILWLALNIVSNTWRRRGLLTIVSFSYHFSVHEPAPFLLRPPTWPPSKNPRTVCSVAWLVIGV